MSAAPSRRRVAVLISGRGSNMTSLIAAAKDPSFPAEIALVLSNRPEAPGLVTARENGITTVAIDHKHHLSREEFERAMQEVLEAHGIELVCLAGFMRILGDAFIDAFEPSADDDNARAGGPFADQFLRQGFTARAHEKKRALIMRRHRCVNRIRQDIGAKHHTSAAACR